MQIYIMRHGEAHFSDGNLQFSDVERPLTEQGKNDVAAMGQWLSTLEIPFLTVFTSPFIRAQQTSVIVHSKIESLLIDKKIETLPFITPSDSAKEVHDFLDGYLVENFTANINEQTLSAILLVSHMPLVSFLVSELTQSPEAPLFATGAIAEINYDVEKMQGTLIRMITPAEIIAA